MNFRVTAAIGAAALVLVIGLIGLYGIVGHNNDQNWQVLQSPGGTVTVIDQPGYYFKGFGTVWTYPRTMEAFYSSHPDENNGTDESIRVTFNDAGNAQVSSYVRVQLPTDTEKRRLMHRDFQANTDYIKGAIRAHLVNCIKASGPVMSASENQSSRKAEFNQIVEEQLAQGLFKMRRTSITLDDLVEIEDGGFDEAGNKVVREKKAVVQATEIVNDASGRPIVIQPSPLSHYGLSILQFSITDIDYDAQTLAQFSAKKESYLNAERSKAQRQEEVQQRLMIEEKGRRQIAEIEAEENQKKAKALIQAQQAAEVAEIDKKRAVTDAQRKVEVAMQSQREAETLKQIAKIEADTAELKKAATISVAEGKQKEIELGGGISDEKRVLAEIAAKRDVNVAEALSKVNVPSTVIVGGDGSGGSMTENLLNMALLKSTGILKEPVESK
jgi:hypothetical protein